MNIVVTPHHKLYRIYAQGTVVVLFKGAITESTDLDETLIVSNGIFDIELKIMKASVVSSIAPDMLNLTVETIFSYSAAAPLSTKELHQMHLSILNGQNIMIKPNTFPYDNKVLSSNIFWDSMSYREVEHLDAYSQK